MALYIRVREPGILAIRSGLFEVYFTYVYGNRVDLGVSRGVPGSKCRDARRNARGSWEGFREGQDLGKIPADLTL